ncbi:MAG: transporter substrate-binding domain-containing protein, partial [Sneathiella sp.]
EQKKTAPDVVAALDEYRERWSVALITRFLPLAKRKGQMMKLKQFLAFAMLLLPISSLSAQGLQKEIVLADSDDRLLNGVAQEVGTRAFGKYNIEFGLRTYPKARALLVANSGIVDGDAYRVYDLQKRTAGKFPNLLRVDVPYISIYWTAFVGDKNKGLKVTGWKDLANYRVVAIRGNKTMEARLNEFVPKENRAVVGKYEQAFEMLLQDRVDIVVGKPSVGVSYLKKYKSLHMIGEFEHQDIYMYLHKKHKQLIPKIEFELREMKKSGALLNIEKMVRDRLAKR